VDLNTAKRISENPKYKELVSKRSSFAWKLTITILVVYYAFILFVAFSPETLGISVSGGMTTWGIPIGMGIIVFSFLLTGIYVKRANGEFDELLNDVKKEIRKEMN